MWELDCEEGWAPKNWYFWTVVLEKNPESPLDYKEVQPVHSEGDPPWDFFGRTDAKAETPALWPPHAKSWLIGKDSDAGRDWGQEEKGTIENEMAGWHHWLNGHEFEWTPGVGDGQGGLACCDSWGHNESDRTERMNWTELNWTGLSHLVMSDSLWFPWTVAHQAPLSVGFKTNCMLLSLLGFSCFLYPCFLLFYMYISFLFRKTMWCFESLTVKILLTSWSKVWPRMGC